MKNYRLIALAVITIFAGFACRAVTGLTTQTSTPMPTATLTPTPLPPIPVQPNDENPDEPVLISGDIPFTSPFFLDTVAEAYVMLEDQAGFIARDREFPFPLNSQAIGPVELQGDDALTFQLALPTIPQGTSVDVDNDDQNDTGVQVFVIAYWSNTWGGPFLEERDGTGWSNAYASTITDPEREDEIKGGTLIVWSPDDQQGFPTSFGEDNLLFTEDDPTDLIPAGYTFVNLDQEPFRFYKESQPKLTLFEGEGAVNDYSDLSYQEAFDNLIEKVSREYPFTEEKNVDWQALEGRYANRISQADDKQDFYRALRDFTWEIPDAHVGMTIDPDDFFEEAGGSFGLVLSELSDGRVIASHLFVDSAAEAAGIQTGAELIEWDGQPINEAISNVRPYFGPYSTEHHKRLEQVVFLTRMPPDTPIQVKFRNPGTSQVQEAKMIAEIEYDSLFSALPIFSQDELEPPIQAEVLDESGLGYIRLDTFSDDYSLLASLWDRYMNGLIDNEVPGLILDLRNNSGGSGQLAFDFAGYFFDEQIDLYQNYYYNDLEEDFKATERPSQIKPGPVQYQGPIVVLVSPNCISACEGFAYAISQADRATIIGHYPTAGAFGEVGRGQYKMPEDISMQFPTGRPEDPQGQVVIEGVGVELDIVVPVTEDSALGLEDTMLEQAINYLLEELGN